jgi:hypothetical protein
MILPLAFTSTSSDSYDVVRRKNMFKQELSIDLSNQKIVELSDTDFDRYIVSVCITYPQTLMLQGQQAIYDY